MKKIEKLKDVGSFFVQNLKIFISAQARAKMLQNTMHSRPQSLRLFWSRGRRNGGYIADTDLLLLLAI